MSSKDIRSILQNGGTILNTEGYMWEFGRRGYLKYGAYTPEVVLEHPNLVESMYREFVHAGSDVVQAFTYFGHREKLKSVGREEDLETLNRTALRLARKVADDTDKIMAAGICNTGVWDPDNETTKILARKMFKEQVEWAVQEKADYIIGETYNDSEEAMAALETIKEFGKGLPAVITMAAYFPDITVDDIPFPQALRKLEEAGAAVVGLNCARGPKTMLPLIKEIRKVCKGPIAAIPVPFRCTDEFRTFQSLKDPETGKYLYPNNLESVRCNSEDIREFAEEAKRIGVQYIGLCCGNCSALFRELAESYHRKPLASKYAPDISLSSVFGEPSGKKYGRADKIRAFMLNLKY
ncbi:S-methylmethionine--homocysteine S-methyltransferase BHMT2-like [Mytilus galloprovincialis]|uniref:S-methylmethionine--homocysteine S-methyltransferase BHMT2-like n=1 Tax=Mytilus galloprovincialis TaxID=29158 RepID=UPI003F7B68F9